MDTIEIHYDEKPELNDPIFIEGLPGIGNVGKLAAEHLIDQLKGKKFAEIVSKHFPPQVVIEEDGIVRLVDNQLYYAKRDGK
ncbi:MAG: PAC2 family protein, partial [Thermoplasmata archaeon]|nr:PAC2 family protein [Thermoplasmata archaeon]